MSARRVSGGRPAIEVGRGVDVVERPPVGVERPPGCRRDHRHGQFVEERAERAAIVAEERVDHGAASDGRTASGSTQGGSTSSVAAPAAGSASTVAAQELEHRGHEVRHVAAHDDRGRVVAPVDVGEGDEASGEPGQRSPVGDAVAHHRHLVDQGRRHGWRRRRPAR